MLVGCDRDIGQPYCGDVTSPQDYGQFVVDGEKGIAQHISGTVWYRCAAGQSFRGKKCIGEPVRVTRAQADGYIREFSDKSGQRWRLPKRKEFERILEEDCDNPALNPNVFPNVEVNNYWLAGRFVAWQSICVLNVHSSRLKFFADSHQISTSSRSC